MDKLKTEYVKVDPEKIDQVILKKAGVLLRRGEVVAFPTETVYGLGANALDPDAVQKIFLAKGRPNDNPLIVHVADSAQLRPLVKGISPKAHHLIHDFWPGPLTLIFPKSDLVPKEVTAGLNTVAVRMPKHPVALQLIKEAGVPIAAPSANTSGLPSPTEGKHVLADLKGKVPLIIDGGKTEVGLESTVIDLTVEPPLILRPGGITLEEIKESIGKAAFDPGLSNNPDLGNNEIPRSPGMKYTHYSPEADVFIINGPEEDRADKVITVSHRLTKEGKKVALLLSEETGREVGGKVSPCYFEVLGSKNNLSLVAHRLFSSLRHADLHGADIVLIEAFSDQGIGAAVMNRIRKAAGNQVIN
ncbi:MAG: L-threonylcarbamoyladenylate synthase [Bacillota bacterium]